MLKHLEERRTALQQVRKRMDSKASLRSQEGKKYVQCLALLVGTEMQIEELQGNKEGRFAERPE